MLKKERFSEIFSNFDFTSTKYYYFFMDKILLGCVDVCGLIISPRDNYFRVSYIKINKTSVEKIYCKKFDDKIFLHFIKVPQFFYDS